MKNYQISPGQLVMLSRMTVDFFREINQEIKYSNESPQKAIQMHYVADLLKQLVDTAYPEKEEQELEQEQHIHIIDLAGLTESNNITDIINGIIKHSKEGEF